MLLREYKSEVIHIRGKSAAQLSSKEVIAQLSDEALCYAIEDNKRNPKFWASEWIELSRYELTVRMNRYLVEDS